MALDIVQRPEWGQLSASDKRLLTPEVLARWSSELAEDDYTLEQVAVFERRRRTSLQTLRSGAHLGDQEWKLLRFLQKHEGTTCTYLEIARYLWQTPARRITARDLVSMDAMKRGFGGMVTTIHGHVHMIRKKLEIDPLRPQHLANIRGVGYRWYSRAPSLDDGENYELRATESVVLREQLYREMGLIEGEFTAIEGTSLALGPGQDESQSAPELPA